MNDIERRVRAAFDEVEVPSAVKLSALSAIADLREKEEASSRANAQAQKPAENPACDQAPTPLAPAKNECSCEQPPASFAAAHDESDGSACEQTPIPSAPGADNPAFIQDSPFPASSEEALGACANRRKPESSLDSEACRDASNTTHVPGNASSPSPAPAVRAAAGRRRWRQAVMALAACLALVAVGFGATKLYYEETAFVGIDVNPSIELGLNRFDIVVSTKAFNEDGERVLDAVPVVGKRYDEALSLLSSSSEFEAYVSGDSYMEISVTSANTQQADELRSQSDACLQSLSCEGASRIATEESRQEAAAVGMGVARYQAARELMALDSTLTLEDCAAMSMRELRDRIVAAGGDASEFGKNQDSSSSGKGSPQGNGSGSGMGRGGNGEKGMGASGSEDGSSGGGGYGGGMGSGYGPGDGTGNYASGGAGQGQGRGA